MLPRLLSRSTWRQREEKIRKRPLNLSSARGERLVLRPRWTPRAILSLIYNCIITHDARAQGLIVSRADKIFKYLFLPYSQTHSSEIPLFTTINSTVLSRIHDSKMPNTQLFLWAYIAVVLPMQYTLFLIFLYFFIYSVFELVSFVERMASLACKKFRWVFTDTKFYIISSVLLYCRWSIRI